MHLSALWRSKLSENAIESEKYKIFLDDGWCKGGYMCKGSIKLVFKCQDRIYCLCDLRTFCQFQDMSRTSQLRKNAMKWKLLIILRVIIWYALYTRNLQKLTSQQHSDQNFMTFWSVINILSTWWWHFQLNCLLTTWSFWKIITLKDYHHSWQWRLLS